MAERAVEFNSDRILMTLQPLLEASPVIQFHVATVVPAAILGAYILSARKGTPTHRLLGKVWMTLMVVTSISTFFIHKLNLFYGFSPIHLLSILVLFGAFGAIAAARRHDIRRHRSIVLGMYLGGIVGAGLFTLLPGRIMYDVIFSGNLVWAVILALAVVAGAFFVHRGFRRTKAELGDRA